MGGLHASGVSLLLGGAFLQITDHRSLSPSGNLARTENQNSKHCNWRKPLLFPRSKYYLCIILSPTFQIDFVPLTSLYMKTVCKVPSSFPVTICVLMSFSPCFWVMVAQTHPGGPVPVSALLRDCDVTVCDVAWAPQVFKVPPAPSLMVTC